MFAPTRRALAAATLVTLAAASITACAGEVPTESARTPPAFNGGATFGSGNYSGGTPDPENTTAADTGSAARGGGATFGSGN